MKVQGEIQDIRSRSTSVGTMYDVIVDGNSYGNGKYSPRGVSQGDYVEFEAEVKGNYKNIKYGSMRKADRPASTSTGSAQEEMRAVKAMPPTDGEKQNIISRQAAFNTSVAWVSTLLDNECVPLPVKPADRFDYTQQLLLNYANMFHTLSTGKAFDIEPAAVPPFNFAKTKAAKKAAAEPSEAAEGGAFSDDDIPF